MRGWTALSLVALLSGAGCAHQAPPTPQQFCARKAENDPEVRALIMSGLANAINQTKNQDELREAREHALRDCLKRQGVPQPPGGVEPQKQSDTLFQW